MIVFINRGDSYFQWRIMDNRGKLGYTNHMETKNTIPQIVADAIAKDFKSIYSVKQTRATTWMVSAGNLCIYYIVNADCSEIIDIQVD